MDKQPMHMPNMHNTFWRENQVIVTFHSATPLISTQGVYNGGPILKELDLDSQLKKLNRFLKENDINFTLSFFNENPPEPPPPQRSSSNDGQEASNFTPPRGVYLFGLSKPIETDLGEVSTSVVTFFNFKRDTSAGMTGSASGAEASSGMDKDDDNGDDDGRHHRESPVARIVNQFNRKVGELNKDNKWQIPISAASPHWLCGATTNGDRVTQGCPLTPPMPVDDSCAYWHFRLPRLSPKELRSMKGEGVTVFILDALPEREVISEAAGEAGDDNLLLLDVNNNVTFNYSIRSNAITMPGSSPVIVGKDVYGRHFAMEMPDHGLYIAGIVRDVAPGAKIECIRVLDKYCVGDMDMLAQALQFIQNRMLPGGDLYQQPVVINMSLVIPTKEEARSQDVDPDVGFPNNDIQTCIRQPIQSLVELGAIIAASAGNEGDLREIPSGNRPGALYPAAFANPPDSIDGIVPVGAVDKHGKATSYSCYPGPRGMATYGGEVPSVDPKHPDPSKPLIVTVSDAVRGIYSSDDYPPLTTDDLQEYDAPNDHAWAYWVGTSFATPVISGVAARILELRSKGASIPNVHNAVIAAAGTHTTNWDKLDPATTGVSSGSAIGPMLRARQTCTAVEEEEEEEEEVDIEVISVVEQGEEVDIEVIDVVVEER